MQYILVFLDGIITFISPCLLPMLPIYISYFAGETHEKTQTLKNALGFVLGFSLLFTAMGALSGTIGQLLRDYQIALNLITGGIVVLFGLSYLGIFRIPFFSGGGGGFGQKAGRKTGFLRAVLFGVVFSISWTPCVSAFLTSALMLASHQGSALLGMSLLLVYSLGLGIPFIISAVLIDQLKTTFDFIKRHYKTVTTVSGLLLIVVGILMMTGLMGYWMSMLSF